MAGRESTRVGNNNSGTIITRQEMPCEGLQHKEHRGARSAQTDAHMLSAQISSETDTVVSPAAPAGLRPMRAARSAKSGMRTAVARP
eukprot:scaffold113788_cov63-Phaeocystis_antarctica.AAC.1